MAGERPARVDRSDGGRGADGVSADARCNANQLAQTLQLEFKGEYEQALSMYTRGREGGGRGASEAQTREPNMPSSYGMASF